MAPRCSTVLVALIALLLLVGVGPVMARPTSDHLLDVHAEEPHAVDQFELPAPGAPTVRLLAVGLALIAGVGLLHRMAGRSRAPMFALGLSLAVGVFTVETAVHSVHHLGHPESAAACVVLTGSQHLSGTEGDAAPLDAPPLWVSAVPLPDIDEIPPAQVRHPHLGRAPPA